LQIRSNLARPLKCVDSQPLVKESHNTIKEEQDFAKEHSVGAVETPESMPTMKKALVDDLLCDMSEILLADTTPSKDDVEDEQKEKMSPGEIQQGGLKKAISTEEKADQDDEKWRSQSNSCVENKRGRDDHLANTANLDCLVKKISAAKRLWPSPSPMEKKSPDPPRTQHTGTSKSPDPPDLNEVGCAQKEYAIAKLPSHPEENGSGRTKKNNNKICSEIAGKEAPAFSKEEKKSLRQLAKELRKLERVATATDYGYGFEKEIMSPLDKKNGTKKEIAATNCGLSPLCLEIADDYYRIDDDDALLYDFSCSEDSDDSNIGVDMEQLQLLSSILSTENYDFFAGSTVSPPITPDSVRDVRKELEQVQRVACYEDDDRNEADIRDTNSKGVRFACPVVTSVKSRPKTDPSDCPELYFAEDELDQMRLDRETTDQDKFEVIIRESPEQKEGITLAIIYKNMFK